MLHRDVAQFGSAHVWGAWSRKFKSCHPDHDLNSQKSLFKRLLRVFFLSETQKCVMDELCCYEADFSILSFSKLEMVSQPRAVASFISCV